MRYLSGPCGLDYIIDLSCDGAAVLCDGSPGFHAHYGGRRDYESRSGLTVGGWIPDRGELIPADSIRWDIGRPLDIDCSATWQRPVVLYEFSAVGCCRKECRGCDGDCRCKGGCCRNGAFAVLVQPQWLGYRNHEDVHFVICDRLADIPDGLPGEPKTFRVGRYRVVEPIDTVAVVQAARLVWEEREVRVLDYRQPGSYPSTWAIVRRVVGEQPKYQIPPEWINKTLPIHRALGLAMFRDDVRLTDEAGKSLTANDVLLRLSKGTAVGTVPVEQAMPPFDQKTVRSYAPWATVLDPSSILVGDRIWRYGVLPAKHYRTICAEYVVNPTQILRIFSALRQRPSGAWLEDEWLPAPRWVYSYEGTESSSERLDFRWLVHVSEAIGTPDRQRSAS